MVYVQADGAFCFRAIGSRADPVDRRSRQLMLTPEGKRFAAQYLDRIFAAEEYSFSTLTEEDRQALISGSPCFFEQVRDAWKEGKQDENSTVRSF